MKSFFDSLSPKKIKKFSIKCEKNKNLKNDIKIIEDLNTPSYIIIENMKKHKINFKKNSIMMLLLSL